MAGNGCGYGLVKAAHYRPIEDKNLIMITKETIKEATTFRKTMLWLGIVTLPIGLGLFFLLMWFNLKCAMDDYQRAL